MGGDVPTTAPEILSPVADVRDAQNAGSGLTARPVRRRNRFFVYTAIAMLFVVAIGFGRSFFLRPVFIDRPLPPYLIAHGAVMTAWYLLFLAQTVLVYRPRVDMHRKLGIAGLVLAFAVVATAIQVQLNVVPRMISLGMVSSDDDLSRAIGFALSSMSSLVPFVVLVALAVLLRRNAAIHKRLMFWAMVWTIGPAFAEGRPLGQMLDPMVQPHLPFFPSDLLWLSALLAYDWISGRRIHHVTWIGFVLLAFYALVVQEWVAGLDGLHDWMRAHVLTPS
jgi:hypothetical protein